MWWDINVRFVTPWCEMRCQSEIPEGVEIWPLNLRLLLLLQTMGWDEKRSDADVFGGQLTS